MIPIPQELIEAAAKGLATAIGKVVGEAGINLFGDTSSTLLDGAGNLTKAAQDLLFSISRKYVKNYTERHGILKVLGMGKPVSLDSVYTKVNFKADAISCYRSIEDLEKGFRKREKKEREKRPGLDAANQEQYLMVLGNPGTGKTTFLRKVGLEALKGKRKEGYQHTCIPVLLELRKFRSGTVDLVQEIASEFQNCGLPEYQDCTEKLLEKGRLLILLDGLDEVPSDRRSEITTQIRDLLDRYSGNRFIASCRIAAYRNLNSFQRCTDVAIADFDDEQIKTFIDKWFESHNQSEWGQQCWSKLNSGEHKATKELTRTPLLLTLICILFKKTGQFPTNRSTLYERTLRVLLEEWDASKEITRTRLYQGLDTKRKELMLAQIAYDNFVEDFLFFPGRTVSKQIEQALGEMLPDEKYIDGRVVLREIELQHGIIIERQENTYSFSHLTLQEYLTALHIIEDEIDIKDLVSKYLCDRRWREVFLILAGLRRADDLLLKMEKAIDSLIDTPKLKNLLIWVEQVTDSSEGDFQPVGKRAIILDFVKDISKANILDLELNFVKDFSEVRTLSKVKPLSKVQVYALANAITNDFGLDFAIAKVLDPSQAYAIAIDRFIDYAHKSQEFKIYKNVNFTEIIATLEKLKQQIPDNTEAKEVHQAFGSTILQTWLKAFHLNPEMVDLSKSELKALDNYFYANLLMVECKKAAVRVSPETWSDIESRMLLPVNEPANS